MVRGEPLNVKPDIITFASATCGYAPLGGVIVSKEIADHFNDNVLYCGLTYSAHPLGCAAAVATIDVYKRKLARKLKSNGQGIGRNP